MKKKLNEDDYANVDEWLYACLEKGICPIESCEKEDCECLVASIDLTFAHIDAGSLRGVISSWLEKRGDFDNYPQRAIQLLVEELEMNSDYCLHSEFLGDRPGGDSEDFWAWSENPEKLRKVFAE
jgi:hypothetical protein